MRFSIIVPVYNVEQYLKKCLDSIMNQTYQDFEVLVINDGTKDNSQSIIDEYVKIYPKKVKSFTKKNGGLSDARNYGVERAKGEYIVFIDPDDYIDVRLLEKLEEAIYKEETPDVIGFSMIAVDESEKKVWELEQQEFFNKTGEEAIRILINHNNFFEAACIYIYNRKFWENNKFKFEKDTYHEDFGLIPIILLKAKKVSCIKFFGYYYYQSQDSITRTTDANKEKKKAYDLIKHFDNITNKIKEGKISEETTKSLNAYMANALLYRMENLKDKAIKSEYKKSLKSRKIYNYLKKDTIKQQIKRQLIKIKLFM